MAGAVAAILLCPPTALASPDAKPPSVQWTDEDSGLVLEVVPARSVMALRGGADLPATRRAAVLGQLLARHFAAHGKQPPYRLYFGPYLELNRRLMAAASCASSWDATRGRPLGGKTREWLRDQIALTDAWRELKPALQAHGLEARVGSIEHVMLCRFEEPAWAGLVRACSTALPAGGRYPCGADLAFVVTFESPRVERP